jgi:hypothetical protein
MYSSAGSTPAPPEGGDDGDRDAAFAAQHQRDPSVGNDLAHPPAGLVEHAEHGSEVVGPALVTIWPPPHHRQVAIVHDRRAGRRQPLGQPGSAQRGGRLLLPRPVRGGAGGDTEQAELTDHRHLPDVPTTTILRPASDRPPAPPPAAHTRQP